MDKRGSGLFLTLFLVLFLSFMCGLPVPPETPVETGALPVSQQPGSSSSNVGSESPTGLSSFFESDADGSLIFYLVIGGLGILVIILVVILIVFLVKRGLKSKKEKVGNMVSLEAIKKSVDQPAISSTESQPAASTNKEGALNYEN